MGKEALRLSTVLAATPQVVFRAWFDSAQHAAFTGAPAKIEGDIGGRFSLRDGAITGRTMALEFGRRLLQSWRNDDFPKGAPDSRLEMLFETVGAGTRLTVMHAELPEGQAEKLRTFWHDAYFAPMTDYFGKFVTLLANTPPSQAVIALDTDEEEEEAEDEPKPKKKKKKLKVKSSSRGASELDVGRMPPPKVKAESKPEKPKKGDTPAPTKADKPPAKPEKSASKAAPKKPAPKSAPAKPAAKTSKSAPAKPAPKSAPAKPAPKSAPAKSARAKAKKADKPKKGEKSKKAEKPKKAEKSKGKKDKAKKRK